MPTAPVSRFVSDIRRLDFTRKRMETLYAEDRIVRRDLHSVYEALFLRGVTSFESFLEDMFIAVMTNRAGYAPGRASVLMTAASKQALMDILLQGDNYLAWLPFHHTERRAKLYLKDGRPFTELTDADRNMLTNITLTRNAIAHRSAYAVDRFRRVVIASRNLLPIEKQPAGFLRATARTAPAMSFFEIYAGELVRIGTKLS